MNDFSSFLNDLIGHVGLGRLADETDIDPAALSRFRSDQGSLGLKKIDALLARGNAMIVTAEDLQKMEETLETISDLWKAERRRNRRRAHAEVDKAARLFCRILKK